MYYFIELICKIIEIDIKYLGFVKSTKMLEISYDLINGNIRCHDNNLLDNLIDVSLKLILNSVKSNERFVKLQGYNSIKNELHKMVNRITIEILIGHPRNNSISLNAIELEKFYNN